MSASQRTILFLISDTGAGHRSAANAIRNAITLLSQQEQEQWLARQQARADSEGTFAPPTYRIEIVDVFEEYSRFPLREAVKLYGPTIRHNPKLYGRVFHLSNQAERVNAVKTVATPLVLNGLIRLITSVQPDVIVSIHPMLNHVTIQALQVLNLHIPFITVVTDLVSIHYSWFAPGADAYVVPTEHAKQIYLKRGLDPKRVHMLGMPIDPKFTLPVESKEALQRKFGLEPGIPVVLLVGGGEGSGGLRSSVQAISQARLPVQLLIITGRNKRLYMHLQRIRSTLRVPAKIFGFVNNMPEMMRAADVIVTKAGPGTICEALACNLPIILSGYVPGQEEGNVTFVTEHNVGVMAYDSIELINTLRRLIKPGSQLLRQQLENARVLARPYASFDIAKCILGFLPASDQPGVWERIKSRPVSRASTRKLSALMVGRRFSLKEVPIQKGRSRVGLPRISSRVSIRLLRRRLKHIKLLPPVRKR